MIEQKEYSRSTAFAVINVDQKPDFPVGEHHIFGIFEDFRTAIGAATLAISEDKQSIYDSDGLIMNADNDWDAIQDEGAGYSMSYKVQLKGRQAYWSVWYILISDKE